MGASILAVVIWNLLVIGLANRDSSGNLAMLFVSTDYAWNVADAVLLPSMFGSLIVGVTLYAGVRLFRSRERRLAGLALLGASAIGLFLLFLASGALLLVIDA